MNDVKQVGGVWLPAHEEHLIAWMQHPKNKAIWDGKIVYQAVKQKKALAYVKQFRNAVDVGAHCGLWSMWLVRKFEHVHAFEPVALHRKCFGLNVMGNYTLNACALGEYEGSVSINVPQGSSGGSTVSGSGDIPLRRLDDFNLRDVDFIKLDCEGYELFALRGGEEMLKRCKPAVIVEQKPGRPKAFGLPQLGAVDYLKSLGAVLREEYSGDYFLTW